MSLKDVAPARSVPNDLNAVIEIPAHSSSIKYEVDKASGMLEVDRFMPTAMHYPCNYGFIPNTLSLTTGLPYSCARARHAAHA